MGDPKLTVPLQLRQGLTVPLGDLHTKLAAIIRQAFPTETDPHAQITISFSLGDDTTVHVEFSHAANKGRGAQK